MSKPQPFKSITPNRPGRSVFNLSYEKKFTSDMGELIPIMCDETIPGDVWDIGNEVIIRLQPMVAPVLHEINVFVHYWFIPYRILDDTFEEFISGGEDGETDVTPPKWTPTDTTEGSLWDYLGFPINVDPTGSYPLDYPRRAYNMIYNEFFRDQNLQSEVSLDNESILLRNWEKDYFTSSTPWQQRGTTPAIPITGTGTAVFNSDVTVPGKNNAGYVYEHGDTGNKLKSNSGNQGASFQSNASSDSASDIEIYDNTIPKGNLDDNTVDMSDASTFDVADMRLAFQIQKFMERNARSGVRYTEFLTSHFGVSPRDDRLQRPEYLGGSKQPVIVSEVLQTSKSETDAPQGNLAGHGLSVNTENVCKYNVQEFGLIMGIMSVMPKPAYQQGIDRQWQRETRYDFPFPEFANLSEQAILQSEIYATGVESENNTIFGYQGRFDECRIKRNQVCAGMRDTFDYWHLGRQFASAPLLNDSFITCNPSKRIFAVQDEDGLIVNLNNAITCARPLPIISNPGLIDHD